MFLLLIVLRKTTNQKWLDTIYTEWDLFTKWIVSSSIQTVVTFPKATTTIRSDNWFKESFWFIA